MGRSGEEGGAECGNRAEEANVHGAERIVEAPAKVCAQGILKECLGRWVGRAVPTSPVGDRRWLLTHPSPGVGSATLPGERFANRSTASSCRRLRRQRPPSRRRES
jgi:hypothetical protein